MVFNSLPWLISHFLGNSLISSLIKCLEYLQTLFLFYSSDELKCIDPKNGSTATESLIKLPKINLPNFNDVEGICTHNAWLNGYKQWEFTDIDARRWQLLNAINFAMPACIFKLVGKIMAGCNHFPLFVNKNTSHRNLLLPTGFKCFLKR